MDPFAARLTTPVQPSDPRYPSRFADLPVPPAQVWVDGRLPSEADRLVAIVGSRAASRAAMVRVADLAAGLAHAGWAVISGGALGIDAAAHRGALDAGGTTFAVLGCGIDVVYPDRHARLFRQIAASGGLLSEYGPGVAPRPGQFPARNRLVAALAQIVIVAEARRGSGALITARQARALGRPVVAMPGSSGTDDLLASDGVAAVESAADVLAILSGGSGRPGRSIPAAFDAVLAAVGSGPVTAPTIADRMQLSLAETLGVLLEAELGGIIVRTPGGKFEARRGN